MCGLAGYFTNYMADIDRERFAFLMLLSQTRGRDSSGVMSLRRYGAYNSKKEIDFEIFKSPEKATDFLDTFEFKYLAKLPDTKGFMGHTRAATIGSINARNAHPHVSKDHSIIGCHNGTLFGDYPHKSEDLTDSEAIMNIISEKGLVGLNEAKGAWALTFLDRNEETFNMITNGQRPLHYVVTAANDFAYASEKWMLEAFLSKFSLRGDVKELEPYKRLKMDLSQQLYIGTMDVGAVEGLEAPKVTTRTGFFQGDLYDSHYQNQEYWHNRGWHGAYDPEVQEEPSRVRGAREESKGAVGETGPIVPRLTRTSTQQEGTKTAPSAARQAAEARKANRALGRSDTSGRPTGVSSPRGTEVDSRVPSRQHLLRALPERQRVTSDGRLMVETIHDEWMDVEDFLDILEHKKCKWCEQSSELEDKRIWVNVNEFILEKAWRDDPECRQALRTGGLVLPPYITSSSLN